MTETIESIADNTGVAGPARTRLSLADRVGAARFGGLYLLVALTVVFVVWEPTFRTASNFRVLAGSQAIAGILTLGLVVSLISGVFDLSIAANMSFSISLVGWLQTSAHLNAALAVVCTLLAGAAIGAVNAVIVTVLRVDPIIGTLGMSAVLAAAEYWLVNGQTLLQGISPSFTKFGTSKVYSIPVPVFYLLGAALVLWYALEHTPWGRHLRAAGSNAQATRLAGIKVVRLQWSALLVSGAFGALAGVVLTMQLGAASFDAGSPYLLPAFAAAFLGTTIIQTGRFNVFGTVVALYLLAVAIKGLQLRYPTIPWIANLIQGVVLIVAVAIVALLQKRRRT
jgi:ribose transport system permease protein